MSDRVHPYPCGDYGDSLRRCTCVPMVVTKYQKRFSGLMLDRIDIHIEVPRVDYEKLNDEKVGRSGNFAGCRMKALRAARSTEVDGGVATVMLPT